jgi:hypothetical protein
VFIRDGMGDIGEGIGAAIGAGIGIGGGAIGADIAGGMVGAGAGLDFSIGGLVLLRLGWGLSSARTFSSQTPRQLKRPFAFSAKQREQRPLQQYLQNPIASTSR